MTGNHFITFEGIDGCGKSTQLGMLHDWLFGHGLDVVATREPGDTPLGAEIRQLLLDGRYAPVAESELLLFLADRAQHVREVVLPALARGAWVLCDRYSDSTLAYQLAARQLESEGDSLQALITFAECGVKPDLTLWFDLPVQVARQRMQLRVSKGEASTRLDDEVDSFHGHVAEAFASLSEGEPRRISRIDASPDLDAVHASVCKTVAEHWPGLG